MEINENVQEPNTSASGPNYEPQSWFEKRIFRFVSPTWAYADSRKRKTDIKSDRTRFIKCANLFYFLFSFATFFIYALIVKNRLTVNSIYIIVLKVIWGFFIMSRCNEVFYAFAKDAYERAKFFKEKSSLTGTERIILALKSYTELVVNFSILYSFFSVTAWKDDYGPHTITDLLFYSATTITTSGNGAIIPIRWYTQLLSTYEIYEGLVLLVICFTLYTSLLRQNHEGAKPDI